MRTIAFPALIGASLLALPAFAAAPPSAPPEAPSNVAVRFTDMEKFTDATYDNRYSSREQVGKDLADHLAGLGKRYLPPGQRLEIEISDIDLAGRYEPWNINTQDVRFMRDVTWPRVNVKYRLLEGEREIASGQEQISDMQYLRRSGLRSSSDRLRYEKAMLDEWFRARFNASIKPKVAVAP